MLAVKKLQQSLIGFILQNGTASTVRALAEAGADLEIKNGEGETPLEIANKWNNSVRHF